MPAIVGVKLKANRGEGSRFFTQLMENKAAVAIKGDLARLIGEEFVVDDLVHRLKSVRDWWPQTLWWDESAVARHVPQVIAQPHTQSQIAEILNWANSQSVNVVVRGGGSGVLGAAIPTKSDSLVIDTTKMNKVLDIEGSGQSKQVRAEAGILGSDLEAALNARGYSLMNFPASIDISTIGGWVSTGSFGQLSTLYGGVADQLVTIKAVLPNGSIVEKNPADFLLSEGTLGVITEVTLKIRDKPKKQFYASFDFGSLNEALGFVRELIQKDVKPAVCRLYDPLEAKMGGFRSSGGLAMPEAVKLNAQSFFLKHPALVDWFSQSLFLKQKWLLVMVFEDQETEFEALRAFSSSQKRFLAEGAARHWAAKRNQWSAQKIKDFSKRACFADSLDTWGAWDKLELLYANVTEALRGFCLIMGHISHFDREGACFYFIMAGGGKTAADAALKHERAWRLAMEAVIRAGAKINHHHGLGLAKLPWKEHAYSKDWFEAFRARKRHLDPKGIMNPGKIL